METIVKLSKCDRKIFDECYHRLCDLITDFSNKYPDLLNLEKFG